ncbi:hypothetical protein BSIN_1474 [Burkholderia singularis]|uniref:Uncharacterized protein n=1 Tax=Burkholderia singularis TaxID=1503053 RepID=A0A238GZ12_9BURK|nr:hypothetical protein BSIN_1474 [Burkholderia singularis]
MRRARRAGPERAAVNVRAAHPSKRVSRRERRFDSNLQR